MKRVLICGGRDYDDRDALQAALDRLHAEHGFAVVIAGGARGADTLAAQWAERRGLPAQVYMAEWEKLGRKAGPIRNQRMLDEGKPALVIAFKGGTGTAGMIALAGKAGVPIISICTTKPPG
jgi:predicted Rossmann-fold nucleotide-binding protein